LKKNKIILIGPASPFRGGISDFNETFAFELLKQNYDVEIISFSLQYPSILFPGKTQYNINKTKTKGLKISSIINSINPISWYKTAKYIKKQSPDAVIIRFWIPFMGLCLGNIAKKLAKNNIPIYAITDNVIPHEKRIGDTWLTKYFVGKCSGFITLSKSVLDDISMFTSNTNKICLFHPIYDIFGQKVSKEEGLKMLNLKDEKYLLFFGLIRDYKGLELAIEAMSHHKIKELNLKLIIAGEFYDSKTKYLDLIQELQLNNIIIHDGFIEKAKVKYFFSISDAIVQPYKTATQSGITQIAYQFQTPMIVTNVGGLPEIVENNKQGFVCDINSKSIAESIIKLYTDNDIIANFSNNVRERKQEFSWETFVNEIIKFIFVK
jgi:glycosyltransferase involved in cell wall biosynthesis